MNPEAPNPDPGEPDDELMSPEELKQWLSDHPEERKEFERMMEESMERTVRGDDGEVPAEMRALAEEGLAKARVYHCIEAVQEKMKALFEVIKRPAGSMTAEERIAQCNARMEEVVDALLESPEPHRTRFLKQLLPIREELRKLKPTGD